MSFFGKFFTPPVFEDELKTQQAYLLNTILWILIFVPIVYFIYALIFTPENRSVILIQFGYGEFLNIFFLYLLRRGYVRATAIMQVSAFWILFTYSAIIGTGVQGEAYLLGYSLVIVFSGILLGGRGIFAFTTLSLVAGAWMVYGQSQGIITSDLSRSPLSTWVVSLVLFPIGAAFQYMASLKVRDALSRARASEERYRLISQVSSDYTFSTAWDSEGNMHLNWVAGAFEEITGFTFDEYVTTGGWLAHLHPDDVEVDIRDMQMISQNKKVVTEVRTITKNREVKWVRVYGHPVWDDKQDQLIGIVGAVQDITEHKLVSGREASHQASLEKVLELGKYVTESNDLKTTYQRIWQSIRYDLDFDRLGIYLYDADRNYIDGTFGTDDQGKMIEESERHISLSDNTLETKAFIAALQDPNGIYFTDQYASKHDIEKNPIMKNVRDFAAIAAWSGNKPIAVLCVDNVISQQSISDEQLESLRLFAGYAGLAIENSRLNDALQHELVLQKAQEEKEVQRRAMLEKVLVLGQLVTGIKNTKPVLEQVWRGIHHTLGFDRLAVFLFNSEQSTMDSMIGTDSNGNMQDTSGISFPVSDTFKMLVEKPDGMFITRNYDVEYNIPKGHEMYGVKDYAAVAAWAGDKPIAVISVDQLVSGKRITDAQFEALRLFAGYAGLALENARLNEALQSELNQQKLTEELESSRRAILEKVVVLGQQVTEVNNLQITLDRIWHAIHDDLEFDRIGIYFYNVKDKSLNMALGTDRSGRIDRNTSITLPMKEWRSFKKVMESHDGYYFTKDYSLENNLPKSHEMYGVKEHAMFVAWAKNKPVAVIVVDNNITRRPITKHQLEAMRLFIGYVGLAIENTRLNEALQSELGNRQTFIDELEIKNAELERFTYTVSHDLKSPLVTISGFLGYLEQDALTGNIERVKSGIKRITTAATKMQALLNDLLELSRVGRIMNKPEDVSFNEIVNEAIDHVHGQLEKLDAVIESQSEYPVVHGDKVRLVEVVQNLIENALKYSTPKTKPHIEISTNEYDSNGYPIFFVRDNGIGIEEQYHENIFGLFNKLDAQSEGTGIGLSLVKRIIEVHNGRIWVRSEKGKGATFYFTLPTPQTKE